MTSLFLASTSIENLADFFDKSGIFIYPIILCSLAAIAITIYQAAILMKKHVMPELLVSAMNNYIANSNAGNAQKLNDARKECPSVLQRLCDVVLERQDRKDEEIQEAVQVRAREEIVKIQAGIPFLEIIIAIAPLLGLLGTATGLFTVFEQVGGDDESYGKMAVGISEALITTVSGLAVAVPAVVVHGFFNRQIENYSAALEVIMDRFVGAYSYARRHNNTTQSNTANNQV